MPRAAKPVPKPGSPEHARRLVRGLAREYPDAVCALTHENPFQLLVATILSAQCTDARVNIVTPALFERYPTPQALAESKQEDVEEIIRSTGFFRSKATNLRGMARVLVDEHGGELPRNLDDLTRLPGVGRKTANVVLGTAFGIATGVVVDTHVRRLSQRLGLTTSSNPVQIEKDLMAIVPQQDWVAFSHRLIHHGRRICLARKPRCLDCALLKLCPRRGLPAL